MERDWAQLGREFAAARTRLGLSQVEVAKAIGASRQPIQAIERGETFSKVTGTMRSYARLVGWTEESIDAILKGGTPKMAEPPIPELQTASRQSESALTPQLPLRIVQELSAESGPVLDATVLDLPGASPGSRMVVVIKGTPDATPEQIREDLLAWSKEQRRLYGLTGSEDGTSGTQEK